MSLTTNDIDDIKQLLVASNRVLLSEVDEMIDKKLDKKLAPIKQQISDLTHFVTDAIDKSNEIHGSQLADHEQRITVLEQHPA